MDSVNSPSSADLPEFLFSSASMTSSVTQSNLRLHSARVVIAAPLNVGREGETAAGRAKLRFWVSANIHRRLKTKTCVNAGQFDLLRRKASRSLLRFSRAPSHFPHQPTSGHTKICTARTHSLTRALTHAHAFESVIQYHLFLTLYLRGKLAK